MASRHQCANCGRDVRDIPDSERRFEGGKWFCSQSCFLTSESSASRSSVRKPSKPRHKWRRRIGWTVGSIVALIVGLSVLGALVGTSSSTKSGAGSGSGSGSRGHPIALRHATTIGGGWWVRVNSVRRNANRLFKGKPPAGATDFLVSVTLTYRGGGKDDAGNVVAYILQTEGAHKASYSMSSDSCGDPKNGDLRLEGGAVLGAWPTLFSGRSVKGPICFQIATNDVNSLMLYSTGNGDKYGFFTFPTVKPVWFALA
jgi:hypothetical protein